MNTPVKKDWVIENNKEYILESEFLQMSSCRVSGYDDYEGEYIDMTLHFVVGWKWKDFMTSAYYNSKCLGESSSGVGYSFKIVDDYLYVDTSSGGEFSDLQIYCNGSDVYGSEDIKSGATYDWLIEWG